MLGVGTYEFLVILVVAVLVLGPEHLPKVMRTMQKVMGTVRQVSTEFQRTMNLEETLSGTRYQSTTKKPVKKKKKPAASTAKPAPAATTTPAPPQAEEPQMDTTPYAGLEEQTPSTSPQAEEPQMDTAPQTGQEEQIPSAPSQAETPPQADKGVGA